MQMPPTDPDPLFEDRLPDLPPATLAMAYACKAFWCARTMHTPPQWLRGVLWSGGREQRLHEVAGTLTWLGSRLTALMIVSHVRAEGMFYDGTRYNCRQLGQEECQRKRAVKALEQLGYQVPLERRASQRSGLHSSAHTVEGRCLRQY